MSKAPKPAPAEAPPAPQFEMRPFPALANRALDILIADTERQINALVAEAGDLVGVPARDGWQPDVANRRFVRALPPTPTD